MRKNKFTCFVWNIDGTFNSILSISLKDRLKLAYQLESKTNSRRVPFTTMHDHALTALTNDHGFTNYLEAIQNKKLSNKIVWA